MGNSNKKANAVLQDHKEMLVVQIVGAKNVPKADVTSESDPYVTLQLQDHKGRDKGQAVKTLHRDDTKDPVWYAYRNLGQAGPQDRIKLKLYDQDDMSADDQLGKIHIAVCDLTEEVKDFDIPTKAGNCTVSIKRVTGPFHAKKRLFLIRHGESKWNEAQDSKNLGGMIGKDHPLNEEGVEQAQTLNGRWKQEQKSDDARVQAFMNAERVFASPLTRATQTALVSLQDHPTIQRTGLRLLRSAREQKNIGGLDTLGVAVGDGIAVRVREKLIEYLGEEKTDQVMCDIDPYDAVTKWWSRKDTSNAMKLRFHDFLSTMRWESWQTAIVAGHSLFFRRLMRKFLSQEFKDANPEFSAKLHKYKMDNGACLCVDFDFSGENPQILDAQFMFGTGLKEGRSHSDNEEEQKA